MSVQVDLFEPSTGPKFWRQALELEQKGFGVTHIGKALGITKRGGCLARDYGLMMQEKGLDDPFVELTEPPAQASRWGTRTRRTTDKTVGSAEGRILVEPPLPDPKSKADA
ncbi:MAG: hypothetical protein IT428_08370 [Planctomycetaceae bacterium]|nr:hypothetical protein [Planctomycetaceae bacterium]